MSQLPLGPLPELPPENGWIRLEKTDLYHLSRRCKGLMLPLILYIMGRTTSHADHPEYADIDIDEFRALTGAGARAIIQNLAEAEKLGFVASRYPERKHHKGGYKVVPEAFAAAPLPDPRTRHCKPRSSPPKANEVHPNAPHPEAAVLAPERIAAFRASNEVHPNALHPNDSPSLRFGVHCDAPPAGLIPQAPPPQGNPDADTPQVHLDEGAGIAMHPEARRDESYCPWGWPCPYLGSRKQEEEPQSSSSGVVTTPDQTTTRSPESTILEALAAERFHGVDTPFVRLLLKECQARAADVTAAEVVSLIHEKGPLARQAKKNPNGLLLRAVSNCCEGDGFHQWRKQREATAAETERIAHTRAERQAQAATEDAEREARRQRLLEHPEECPLCHGRGRYGTDDRYLCNCPAAGQAGGGA